MCNRVDVYPFYCSEQLTSTGRVILTMLRLQQAGVVDSTVAPSAAMLWGRLQFVVDELARRQAGYGAIGYWSRDGWTDPWLLLSRSTGSAADSVVSLDGLLEPDRDGMALPLRIEGSGAPVFYAIAVDEVPLEPPTRPDAQGMIVERWYESFEDGKPVTEVHEGDLVRGRLRVTVPADREFVVVEDLLPAGLEVVDASLRTSSVGPFQTEASQMAEQRGDRANPTAVSVTSRWMYGTWERGWWSPWEHKEIRDDRVVYFARTLWKGSYTATYVARATTAGTFVRPPAHAEEMYNQSLGGRSDGGTFRIVPRQ